MNLCKKMKNVYPVGIHFSVTWTLGCLGKKMWVDIPYMDETVCMFQVPNYSDHFPPVGHHK